MKNKKTWILAFIILLQLGKLSYTSILHEWVAVNGETFKFKIEGYDPIDPWRGKYLNYMINQDNIYDESENDKGKCYIHIQKDKEGYAYLHKAVKEKPNEGNFITAKKYSKDYYEIPFTNYYIKEEIAPEAEKLLQENMDSSYILINAYRGVGVVKGLYINNKRIEAYFQ